MSIEEMGLTEKGFERPTFNDILDAKVEKAKELFGEDIDTSEFSVLGKFIRINAFDLAKAYEDLELIYYARFPNTAEGVSLDRLCVFAGIKRNPATAARHQVSITGTVGYVVPAGFVVSTENEITFESVEDVAIDAAGTGTLLVECTEAGLLGNVGEDAISVIVNPDMDVFEIAGSKIVDYAKEEESDIELRKRFAAAIEGVGSANANALRAAILRVPTVISVGIIENDTNETDEKGRPGHSFECFVYGGLGYEQEIGEAIFAKKPIGIKVVSTSAEPVRVHVLDDGGYVHEIAFSRTEDVNIKFRIEIKKDAKFETDGIQQIQDNLTSYVNNLGVGVDVIISSLYSYIHSVAGVVEVVSIAVSTNGGTSYNSSNIAIEDWQVAQTTAADVLVEVSE